MKYYKAFSARIKAQTQSGLKITMDCVSPAGLLDEALGMAFAEHGEAYVRAMVEKTLERQIQYKKQYEETQNAKRKT